jgi:hypothetical protein
VWLLHRLVSASIARACAATWQGPFIPSKAPSLRSGSSHWHLSWCGNSDTIPSRFVSKPLTTKGVAAGQGCAMSWPPAWVCGRCNEPALPPNPPHRTAQRESFSRETRRELQQRASFSTWEK